MLCKAPVNFSLQFQKYHFLESVQGRIASNRKTALAINFPDLENFCVVSQIVSRLLHFLIHSPGSGAASGRAVLDRWMFLLVALDSGDMRTFLPAQRFISHTLSSVILGISRDANFTVQKHLLDSVAQHATLAKPIAMALRPLSLDQTGTQFVDLFRVVVNIVSPDLTDSALHELLSRFSVIDWLAQRPSHALRFQMCALTTRRLLQEQSRNEQFSKVCKYLSSVLISLGAFAFPEFFSSFWQTLVELTTVSLRQSTNPEPWLDAMWRRFLAFPLDSLAHEESMLVCNALTQLVATIRSS